MLAVGRSLPGGDASNLHWIEGDVETADLAGPYGIVVAGAAIHWFDLTVALPLFAELLADGGCLVVLDGDGAVSPAWHADEFELMLEIGERRTGIRPEFQIKEPEQRVILEHPLFSSPQRRFVVLEPSKSVGRMPSKHLQHAPYSVTFRCLH